MRNYPPATNRSISLNRHWLQVPNRSLRQEQDRKIYVVRKNPNSKRNKNNEFSLNIPGMHHILKSDNNLAFKFFWCLVMACSVTICIFQINDRVQYFLSKPRNNRISLTRHSTVKFPSVTVCPPLFAPIFMYHELFKLFENYSDCEIIAIDLIPKVPLTTIWNLMNIENKTDWYDIYPATSATGRKGAVSEISMSDKLKIRNTLNFYGNCSTYTIYEPIPFQGVGFSVEIVFNLQPEVHANCNIASYLMYMFHHDDEDLTYSMIPQDNNLMAHNSTKFSITTRRFKILNRPEAPCDSVAVVNLCQKNCLEHALNISCKLPFMSHNINTPFCDDANTTWQSFIDTLFAAISFSYTDNCTCPILCEEIMYSYDRKATAFSTDTELEYYFEDNVVFDTEEYYFYTIIPFLCEVGGNLGLYLGLCIPALIELLQSFALYCYHKFVT